MTNLSPYEAQFLLACQAESDLKRLYLGVYLSIESLPSSEKAAHLNQLLRMLSSMQSLVQDTLSLIVASKTVTPLRLHAGSHEIPESPTENSQPDSEGWSILSCLVQPPPDE